MHKVTKTGGAPMTSKTWRLSYIGGWLTWIEWVVGTWTKPDPSERRFVHVLVDCMRPLLVFAVCIFLNMYKSIPMFGHLLPLLPILQVHSFLNNKALNGVVKVVVVWCISATLCNLSGGSTNLALAGAGVLNGFVTIASSYAPSHVWHTSARDRLTKIGILQGTSLEGLITNVMFSFILTSILLLLDSYIHSCLLHNLTNIALAEHIWISMQHLGYGYFLLTFMVLQAFSLYIPMHVVAIVVKMMVMYFILWKYGTIEHLHKTLKKEAIKHIWSRGLKNLRDIQSPDAPTPVEPIKSTAKRGGKAAIQSTNTSQRVLRSSDRLRKMPTASPITSVTKVISPLMKVFECMTDCESDCSSGSEFEGLH